MSQIPRKLIEIRKTNQKQSAKLSRQRKKALVCFVIFLVFLFGYLSVSQIKSIQELPIYSLIFGVSLLASVISFLGFLFLAATLKPLSYEKELFLKILSAYESIESYVALPESSSQERESNLQEAKELLEGVSEELLVYRTASSSTSSLTTSELYQEAKSKYVKIGELLQTKILYYLRNKKELPLIQQKILVLANAFAEANSGSFDFCIKRIEEIPQSGEFEPKPSFLQSKPHLRSMLIHGGRFVLSFVLVTGVAYVLSLAFSISMSNFIVGIIPSAVALFALWESKSK